jgi:hypothetical protein
VRREGELEGDEHGTIVVEVTGQINLIDGLKESMGLWDRLIRGLQLLLHGSCWMTIGWDKLYSYRIIS